MEQLDAQKPRISPLALLLSLLLNLAILLLFLLATHKELSLAPRSSKKQPTIFFDQPLARPAPTTIPAQQIIAQPQPTTPPDSEHDEPTRNEEKQRNLAYLAEQLISLGTGLSGNVVLSNEMSANDRTEPDSAQEFTEPIPVEDELTPATADQQMQDISTQLEPPDEQTSKESEVAQETIKTTETKSHASGTVRITKPKDHAPLRTIKPPDKKIVESNASKKQPQTTQTKRPRNQLTLADLTNSFIKQVNKSNASTYHYQSTNQGTGSGRGVYSPAQNYDSKQIAMQMYCSKVFVLLQQAMNMQHSLTYAQNDFSTQSLLELTIEKDGKLRSIRLNPPLEEKDFERTILTSVKRAGLLPPLPKYFDTEVLTVTMPIHIVGKKGFGDYNLSYNVNGYQERR